METWGKECTFYWGKQLRTTTTFKGVFKLTLTNGILTHMTGVT